VNKSSPDKKAFKKNENKFIKNPSLKIEPKIAANELSPNVI
jgi:hypothetical protein